jgi:class 3 adenylate cyclase
MPWNEQKSRDRVVQNDFSDFEVNVCDLARTMDFHELGTKDVRSVNGVHIYADVPNFHKAVTDAGNDKTEQKKLIRAASVLRRVQGDLLIENDIGEIQQQAARLHCLNFKPYHEEDKRAKRAVGAAIILNSYLYDVFNDVFRDVINFHSAVGLASGRSYIANIGFHGDRELICLGTCANLGAKVINGTDTITITEDVYKLLSDCLKEYFEKSRTVDTVVTYQAVGLRWSKHPSLMEELGLTFDAEKLKKKTEDYRDAWTLSEMEITEANSLIDPDNLTERKSKRTPAVAIFADLDGFTKYVQEAEEDNAVIPLVRQFHMIRREFHCVIKDDYPGLVLQHQGDRTFAIMHMPSGDNLDERCQNAVNVAIGLQSSMEHVLNERLVDRKDIHVAVGLDVGTALVTRLGKKGNRIVICIGPGVSSAEGLQLRSSAQEIRISETIFDVLKDKTLREQFKKDGDSYVAKRLTFPRLDELEEERAAYEDRLGVDVVQGRIQTVTSTIKQTPPKGSTRPWCSKWQQMNGMR